MVGRYEIKNVRCPEQLSRTRLLVSLFDQHYFAAVFNGIILKNGTISSLETLIVISGAWKIRRSGDTIHVVLRPTLKRLIGTEVRSTLIVKK